MKQEAQPVYGFGRKSLKKMRMSGGNASKASLDELFQALSDVRIMSDPIELQDWVVIPVAKMGMTLGVGPGRTGQDGGGEGRARCSAGGGVGIFPVAVVAIDKEISGRQGVKVVSVSSPEDSISDVLHSVMERLMGQKEKRE
jgi:uncharacterized spore protein YtfJ